jgi:hypothetical protein
MEWFASDSHAYRQPDAYGYFVRTHPNQYGDQDPHANYDAHLPASGGGRGNVLLLG